MGKCPDCHHLSINWLVRKRFAMAIRNLDKDEFLPPAIDQNDMGRANNKVEKATNPRRITGSKEKILKRKLSIDENRSK